MPKKTTTFSAYRCERGCVRNENQDAVFADDINGIYIVADGMGGHNAGATASRSCIRLICQELKKNDSLFLNYPQNGATSVEITRFLEFCLQSASRDIFQSGKADKDLKGMGTTCSLVVISGTTAFLAHVGDSRVYLLRKKKLYQVSDDHSVVNELLRRGHIATDKTADIPPEFIPVRNAITRAIGSEENVEIDTQQIELLTGDRLLLCSDGFSRYYDSKTDVERVRLLSPDLGISKTADICFEFAERQGGEDNISVIVVDYNPDDPIVHLKDIEADLRPVHQLPNELLIKKLENIGTSITLADGAELSIDDALIYLKKGRLTNSRTKKVITKGYFLGLASLQADTHRVVHHLQTNSRISESYISAKSDTVHILHCDGERVRNHMQSDPAFGRDLLLHIVSQLIALQSL